MKLKTISNLVVGLLFCGLVNAEYVPSSQPAPNPPAEQLQVNNPDENINPNIPPTPAKPGESVEGRTEFTTPAQNEEINDEYQKLMHENSEGKTVN